MDYQQLLMMAIQATGNILQDKRVPVNVYNSIMSSLQSNTRIQQSILVHILERCINWQQGIDHSVFIRVIWEWLVPILQQHNVIDPNAQMPSYVQGINPNIGQQLSPTALYNTEPTDMSTEAAKQVQQPIDPVIEYSLSSPRVQQMNANLPRYSDEARVFAEMPDSDDVKRTLCDDEIFSQFKDDSVKSNLLEIRVYKESYTRYASLTQKRRFNEPLESFLATAACIPSEYFHSRWMHEINYRQLVHIPINTEKYLDIITRIENYVASVALVPDGDTITEDDVTLTRYPWQAILKLLGDENRNTWDIIDKLITPVINNYLYRYFRLLDTRKAPQISTIADMEDLADVRNGLKVADHGAYPIRVYTVAYMALKTYFNRDNVISIDDKHFGDFIACNKVSYFKNGYTEYDYGCMATEDERIKFRQAMMSNHTVLRIPRRLLITNILPKELVNSLKKHAPDTNPPFIIPKNTFISNLLYTVEAETKPISQALIHVDDKSGYKERSYFELGKTMTNEHLILPFKG